MPRSLDVRNNNNQSSVIQAQLWNPNDGTLTTRFRLTLDQIIE